MNIYSHVDDGDPRMEALVERLYGGDDSDSSVTNLPRVDEA